MAATHMKALGIQQTLWRNRRIAVVFALLFLFVFYRAFPQAERVVLIDAGSSGNRLMVFEHRRSRVWPIIKVVDSVHFEGGISEMTEYQLDSFLDALIARAEESAPPNAKFCLLATAGMRMKSHIDQDRILSLIRAKIRQSHFQLDESCIRVISGEDEAVYGWLSLNYLLNTLENPVGFLDLGGASAQVAFRTEDPDSGNYQIQMTDYQGLSVQTSLFVRTWMGYGTKEMYRQLTESKQVDPCISRGGIFQGRSGLGDFDLCLKQTNIFDPGAWMMPPIPNTPFYGVSEYFYTLNDVLRLNENYNYAHFKHKSTEFCQKDWHAISKDFADKKFVETLTEDRLHMQCFKSAWLINLLHNGFKFKYDVDLKCVNKIREQSVSWTLGALLLDLTKPDQ